MPDTSKRHPAEHDFDHPIRGKVPAHFDHEDKVHHGKDYEDGGPQGHNLQEGFAGGSSRSSDPGEPMRYTVPGGTGVNEWGHRVHTHEGARGAHGSESKGEKDTLKYSGTRGGSKGGQRHETSKHGGHREGHVAGGGGRHIEPHHEGHGNTHHNPAEGGIDFTVPPVKR